MLRLSKISCGRLPTPVQGNQGAKQIQVMPIMAGNGPVPAGRNMGDLNVIDFPFDFRVTTTFSVPAAKVAVSVRSEAGGLGPISYCWIEARTSARWRSQPANETS